MADVASGETKKLSVVDGVQPNWSPSGYRIAYTARRGDPTQMDIWTVTVDGGEPTPVTQDVPTDWSPVWSPDGQFIYFASDRGGSMNLWRVQIDEKSGQPLAEPQPITTPATFLAHPDLSVDGRPIAYTSVLMTQNVQYLNLDSSSGEIRGEPGWVTSGSIPWSSPDPSPDGQWVTFYSRVQPEGGLYVARIDGTGRR